MTDLVTGGTGFIGSQMTYALLDRGESVVVLDNLCAGICGLVSAKANFVQGEAGDMDLAGRTIGKFDVDAVIHFAGSVVVPESVADLLKYYANNTMVSRALVEACVATGVRHFIFSSTAAAYGMGDGGMVRFTKGTDQSVRPLQVDDGVDARRRGKGLRIPFHGPALLCAQLGQFSLQKETDVLFKSENGGTRRRRFQAQDLGTSQTVVFFRRR